MFVDDEAALAALGGEILTQLGYSATIRTSSVEALKLFRAKPDDFDLVISDMTMPNLTGDKLCAEIHRIRPDIPFILCTGYSKWINAESAREMGVEAFVHKPIVRAEFAGIVRKVLDAGKGAETA